MMADEHNQDDFCPLCGEEYEFVEGDDPWCQACGQQLERAAIADQTILGAG